MKITDLQLVDEFTSDLNLPVDDTIQTYRATGTQVDTFMRKAVFNDTAYSIPATVRNIYAGVTANRVYTLPTAAGALNQVHRIVKTTANAYTVTIATTSSQTIGGRASSSIVLQEYGDFVEVVSDNTNWQIIEKRETEVLTNKSNSKSVVATSGTYHAMVNGKLTLTYGVWKVIGQAQMYGSANSQLYITNLTGLYAANGADSGTQPTTFASSVLYKGTASDSGFVFGNTIMGGISATSIDFGAVTPLIVGYFRVTSNTDVYLVPKVNTNGTTTGATIETQMIAERLF